MTPPAESHALRGARRLPAWLLGLGPLVLVTLLVAALFALDLPGLDRRGVPQEVMAVERTVLRPGVIELHLRNDGADPVRIAQVAVNDAYIPTAQVDPPEVGRLDGAVARIPYDWIEGEAYEVTLVTATGATVGAEIEAAVETPARDAGFFGLMALLGLYVGIIPVTLGMLWLPFVRRVRPALIRLFMAATVGLLAFLAVDALLEGVETGGTGAQAFGGAGLVLLGALVAYVALSAVDAAVSRRGGASQGMRLATLVAIGIGLHNLGEGLAIGSAYAVGELALGAFLVVGFALHNTTEGLAIVAPVAGGSPRLGQLLALGAVAGAPAVLGAWIGGVAFTPPLAALLLGVGVGAIVQVAVQLLPTLRDPDSGRVMTPLTAGGLTAGVAVMYLTSLMIAG
ncbi:MAG: ZIP family metal transporter [Actinomycetota bacterium]